jgi:hypothetical protein
MASEEEIERRFATKQKGNKKRSWKKTKKKEQRKIIIN